MNKTIGIRVTLIGAAAAAVSIPLLAQLLRGTNPGPAGSPGFEQTHSPAATAPARLADVSPARATTIPAVVTPTPSAAPVVALVPVTKPTAPATAPTSPVPSPPAPAVAIAAPTAPAPATRPEQSAPPAPETGSIHEGAATVANAAAPAPAVAPASRPAAVAAPAAVVYDAGGKPIDPEKVVIRVGGEKLTADEVDAFISNLPPDQQAMLRSEGRRGLADYLVKTELLAREAKSRKLDHDPRVQRQMRLVQDQLLARAMVGDLRDGVDDASVRKFFEEHRDAFERVHARHILVRAPGSRIPLRPGQKEWTEEQARARATDIYNRVKAGADFAKVAREESDDVGSGAEGGDMGSIRRGTKMEAFEKAVFALKEGEISPPIRSPMGWHVIQVLERFDSPEKLAEQIRAILGPQKTQELIQGLEKDQKVDVDDTFFGPPLAPEPALPEPAGPAAAGTPTAPVTGGASQPARSPAPR